MTDTRAKKSVIPGKVATHFRFTLAVGCATALGFAYGVQGYRKNWFPVSSLREILDARRAIALEEQFRDLSGASGIDASDSLASLGYASGYETAGAVSGVQVRVPAEMEPGHTLLYSSHQPGIFVINDSGKIVYERQIRAADIWPDFAPNASDPWHPELRPGPKKETRRAQILDDGDIMVLFEYFGLARLSPSGEVKWKTSKTLHHDFEVLADGRTAALGRRNTSAEEIAARFPGTVAPVPVYEDFVVVYSKNGEELNSISILDAILNSDLAHSYINSMLIPSNAWLPSPLEHFRGRPPLSALAGTRYDLLHANSVRLASADFLANQHAISDPAWIVSLRNPSLVVAIDCETGVATWIGSGNWIGQHQAIPLESGSILLFDNQGGSSSGNVDGVQSRVIEIEVPSGEISWSYSNEGDLFSLYQGYVERLSNGNTLITETGAGRALEITREGKIVWEWISPFRNPSSPEQVATLIGAHRIPMKE